MEFKGTPGKWFQSHRKSKHGEYSTEVFCENGETICTLAWYPKPKEKAVVNGKLVLTTGTYREANAKLISKAPEMLEMLKYILNKTADGEPFQYDDCNSIEQLIKEATEI